ncbi:hypothetical protein C8T65DRAFT_766154 [Cerioporus squamosus]|nr:hypothetical protein C8T65DRAFT_766154 [Cerioporus squamosus]
MIFGALPSTRGRIGPPSVRCTPCIIISASTSPIRSNLRNSPTSRLQSTLRASWGRPPAGEALPAVVPNAVRKLYPEQYPDFIRVFLSANKDGTKSIKQLVDIWEIKDHNIRDQWHTQEARNIAWNYMTNSKTLDQVYNQAMAAFAHNAGWKKVFHLLIVGIYFSQFVFTRPDGEIKRPLTPMEINNKLSTEEARAALTRLRDRIAEHKARVMPTVEYFNQPVLVFHAGAAVEMRLSQQFLYAIRLPLKEFKGCKFQPSWFSPSSDKPEPVPANDSYELMDPVQTVRDVLVNIPAEELEKQLKQVTHESPATTTTSAASAGFIPSRWLQRQVEQQSPLVERMARQVKGRLAPAALGINDEEEDEEDEEEEEENGVRHEEEGGGEEDVHDDGVQVNAAADAQVLDAADGAAIQVYVNPHDDLEYV